MLGQPGLIGQDAANSRDSRFGGLDRRLPQRQLLEHQPQGPEVAGIAVLLVHDPLRGHIGRRPHIGPGHGLGLA
jgi:hypothetical protein